MVRDRSQIPVERLALLLLQRARQDNALLRRVPANDDAPALNTIVPNPAFRKTMRRHPSKTVDAAGVAVLEELISIALVSAQDAEDVARAAVRRANRGVAVAVGLGVLAMVVATAGSFGTQLYDGAGRQVAAIERQFQTLDPAPSPADAGRTFQGQAGMHEASVTTPAPSSGLPNSGTERTKPAVWSSPTG